MLHSHVSYIFYLLTKLLRQCNRLYDDIINALQRWCKKICFIACVLRSKLILCFQTTYTSSLKHKVFTCFESIFFLVWFIEWQESSEFSFVWKKYSFGHFNTPFTFIRLSYRYRPGRARPAYIFYGKCMKYNILQHIHEAKL